MLLLPQMVSSNIEAWIALTPVKVSVPVEASPDVGAGVRRTACRP